MEGFNFRLCAPALALTLALCLNLTTPARAETAVIAVATNFAEAADTIARDFQSTTSYRVKLSFGATGKLYAQVHAGAPYDVFLAADQARPEKLVAEGLAVAGTRFTYAIGQLTLWSADGERVKGDPAQLLAGPSIRTIAIANPALAPYGLAARQTLEKLRIWPRVSGRIVMAENIGQTFALVATGNATVGFVARPLLAGKRGKALAGSRWDVPAGFHDPIRQDAVLLQRAAANSAALRFVDYLKGRKARAIMIGLGYKVPDQ